MPSMERGLRRLTIEVSGGDATITGRLIDEEGASLPFSGWLGLASGLERALEPGRGLAEAIDLSEARD